MSAKYWWMCLLPVAPPLWGAFFADRVPKFLVGIQLIVAVAFAFLAGVLWTTHTSDPVRRGDFSGRDAA